MKASPSPLRFVHYLFKCTKQTPHAEVFVGVWGYVFYSLECGLFFVRVIAHIYRVTGFVRFGNLPQDAAGHADGYDICGNGFCNHAPCADYGVVADGYAREYRRASANPNIAADGNGFCDFQACFALFGVGGMFGGGEATVRTDEHIVDERDLCTVLNHQIMVGIKIISNRYVVAVITPKRRGENSLFAHFSNQFFENRLLSCAVIGRQLIVFPAFILAFLDFRLKRGIVASLKQAVERYFRFSPILNPRGSAYSPGACP